ncbi:MAG: hypothetical protein AMJ79_14300 [Phycisphaerae bacterium SM23_30]|nr:MAG: hypothetical protein AMJ79_14300 [Phycisphaerae bacterium SM23_30]
MKSEEKFARLLDDRPLLHDWASTPQSSLGVLKYIYHNARPQMTTLETGAGHTTVAFAIVRTRHTCITPYRSDFDNVIEYCRRIGVDTDCLTFIDKSSDMALAGDDPIPSQLDFVFIDGAHRFPYPVIDWHYTQNRLKVGGILGLDDTAMPSVRVLYDFLRGEDEWKIIKKIEDTVFFRKTAEAKIVSDWRGQNMNRASKWKRKTSLINAGKRTVKKFIKSFIRSTPVC